MTSSYKSLECPLRSPYQSFLWDEWDPASGLSLCWVALLLSLFTGLTPCGDSLRDLRGRGTSALSPPSPCGMVPFSDYMMRGRHCARWVWLNQGFVNSNSVARVSSDHRDATQGGEWYQNKYFKHSFIRYTYGSSQQNPACTSAIFYPQNSNFPWICERLWEKER